MYVSGCLPAGLSAGLSSCWTPEYIQPLGLSQGNKFTQSKAANSGKFDHTAHPTHTQLSDVSYR